MSRDKTCPTSAPNGQSPSWGQELSRTYCILGTKVLMSHFCLPTIPQGRFNYPTLQMKKPREPGVPKATEAVAMSSVMPFHEFPLTGRGLQQAALAPGPAPRSWAHGTYHTSWGVYLAVRHALEVSSAAPVVPRAVPNRPKGGQQVIDGFEVCGQHCFFP